MSGSRNRAGPLCWCLAPNWYSAHRSMVPAVAPNIACRHTVSGVLKYSYKIITISVRSDPFMVTLMWYV